MGLKIIFLRFRGCFSKNIVSTALLKIFIKNCLIFFDNSIFYIFSKTYGQETIFLG